MNPFSCQHRKTTWPRRAENGEDYVRCLDCGRALPYSFEDDSFSFFKVAGVALLWLCILAPAIYWWFQ